MASNRRIDIGPNGMINRARSSSCADPEVRALPVGVIDPYLLQSRCIASVCVCVCLSVCLCVLMCDFTCTGRSRYLRTVMFFSGQTKVASLHFYATHRTHRRGSHEAW